MNMSEMADNDGDGGDDHGAARHGSVSATG